MKKLLVILAATILASFSFYTAKAQTIVLDESQDLAISSPGFFPFSSISNDQFIEIFPTNPIIDCQFTNFTAGPLTIAAAMDFAEIGPRVNVSGNKTVSLDFSGASSTMGEFGISLVPISGPSVFIIRRTGNDYSHTRRCMYS